jgi:hypothetical protein
MYKFTGAVGETLLLINYKLYFFPFVFIFLGAFFYKLFVERNTQSHISLEFYKKEILSYGPSIKDTDLIKAFNDFSIYIEILSVEKSYYVTRYNLNLKDCSMERFLSTVKDLSQNLYLNIRPHVDMDYTYIEIANSSYGAYYFSNVLNHGQNNMLMFMDSNNNKLLLSSRINLLIYGDINILHSIIMQIFFSPDQNQLNLIGEFNNTFLHYSSLINYINLEEETIYSIIKEIEYRHFFIKKKAKNIQEYNKNYDFLDYKIYIINGYIAIEQMKFILEYGSEVGIFLYLYSSELSMIVNYKDFFSKIITGYIELNSPYNLLNNNNNNPASYLLDKNDCIISYEDNIKRITLVTIDTDDLIFLINYLKFNKFNN